MSDRAVFLEALTPEAAESLGAERVPLQRFPFRVGRESRMIVGDHGMKVVERRKAGGSPNNDLYLVDAGTRLQVSRNHFQIEQTAAGYQLRDRGSACGTLVGPQQVGGNDRGGICHLAPGEIIVVGTSTSPFVFRFVCLEG